MVKSDSNINVNGTLIWYYYICKREVWLMSHSIEPDQSNSNIDLGRFIHEQAYKRTKKEISIGNIKVDTIRHENNQLVIGEVKKSSKFEHSAKMQLAFYLYELKKLGIEALGELLFPKEKKKINVTLDDNLINEINDAKRKILIIAYQEYPPKPDKIPFCRNCAYSEFCWA